MQNGTDNNLFLRVLVDPLVQKVAVGNLQLPDTVLGAGNEALNKRHKLVSERVPTLLSKKRKDDVLISNSQAELAALQGLNKNKTAMTTIIRTVDMG